MNRAFFADGLVAALGGLHLYDAGGLLAPSPEALHAEPFLCH